MTKPMNRRIFLRGLGGAAVAAPFLSSIGDRSARAQTTSPKRLIAMFTHYGCLTTRFFPKVSHGQLTTAILDATPTLKALSPYADKVLIPRGIRGMNEWTASLKRGQGNDPHTQVVGSYFTCQPVTPNSDNPFSFESATKFNAKPMGPSLDHVIAKQLSADGTPLFIRVGNRNDTPQSGISYSAAETAFPGLGKPSDVYKGLTGLFGGGGVVTPDDYAAVKGKSVIDIVRDDLDTLERFDMSQADKLKLEAWKELLDSTGTVMASAQCSAELGDMIGATKANTDAVGGGAGSTDTLTSKVGSTQLDQADVYMSVAALAAICASNPVIFLKFPGGYTFSGLGVNMESHNASHRIGNAGMTGSCVNGVLDALATIDEYYSKKFAYLVGLLNGVDEGDGKVLDNCAAVWFNEMSDGNAHNLNNLPIVQVGSAGGYFKTGWSVNVEDGSADLTQGRSEDLCVNGMDTVDGTKQTTGTEPEKARAPINKYYVNLMNALGVKAGPDGFAAKDDSGQGEVTHFGMYDSSEDFIGGGSKPAKINSPGGFDALKAGAV
jgi:hypothetical protein